VKKQLLFLMALCFVWVSAMMATRHLEAKPFAAAKAALLPQITLEFETNLCPCADGEYTLTSDDGGINYYSGPVEIDCSTCSNNIPAEIWFQLTDNGDGWTLEITVVHYNMRGQQISSETRTITVNYDTVTGYGATEWRGLHFLDTLCTGTGCNLWVVDIDLSEVFP
jgi:hypothetical protein